MTLSLRPKGQEDVGDLKSIPHSGSCVQGLHGGKYHGVFLGFSRNGKEAAGAKTFTFILGATGTNQRILK